MKKIRNISSKNRDSFFSIWLNIRILSAVNFCRNGIFSVDTVRKNHSQAIVATDKKSALLRENGENKNVTTDMVAAAGSSDPFNIFHYYWMTRSVHQCWGRFHNTFLQVGENFLRMQNYHFFRLGDSFRFGIDWNVWVIKILELIKNSILVSAILELKRFSDD